jgi:hypothetical protein
MTLTQLYDTIDWSGTEEALEEWKSKAVKRLPEDSYEEFAKRWRCTLIAYALPVELHGQPLEGWNEDRMHAARQALGMAGVWDKIVDTLIVHGLLEGMPLETQEN